MTPSSGCLVRSRAESGFTLIESLIALTILAVALLMGVSLVLQQPRILRRLDAHRAALRSLDATLESVRAGAIPLQSAHFDESSPEAPRGLRIWLTVAPAGHPPGLYEVSARASYLVEGRMFERQVETLVWRPET